MMMTIASWCDPLVGLLTPGNRRSVASSADLGGVPVRGDEGWRGLPSSPSPQSSSQRLYSPAPPWSPSPRLSSSPSPPLIHCQGAPPTPLVIFAPSSDCTGKGNKLFLSTRSCAGIQFGRAPHQDPWRKWAQPLTSMAKAELDQICWTTLLKDFCNNTSVFLQEHFSISATSFCIFATRSIYTGAQRNSFDPKNVTLRTQGL